ncbi:DUF4303 domain-containing protein [Zooshikella ganghwensis]|uniref:DUF4303 domain-containing protein n=1 Tax=Zooshikella ganghwensis TaxID=202772 RepID=UPI00146FA996|nr:DUF4303 domain-containing protein [Zooshikella ganghwensis]
MITELLLDACKKCVSHLKQEMKDKIYAFVLYPSSGFRDFGLAISTKESLKKSDGNEGLVFDEDLFKSLQNHPDLLAMAQNYSTSKDYFELTASEWDNVSIYPELFESLNDYIYKHYDRFYEEGLEPQQISDVFKNAIISVFKSIEKAGLFNDNIFERDVLKGVQFSDLSNPELIKSVSAQVNSSAWHKKLSNNIEKMAK